MNRWISKEFQFFRGIRQGCPVSALLFILCTEIMAINIRNNQSIEGIKIKTNQSNKELKISQYADDGTLILHDSNHIFYACIR